MEFEQPHNDIIDKKESQELKSEQIDRVEDEGVNSYDDLKTFLEEQSTQAQELLTKKADSLRQDLNAVDIDQALQEALNQITEVLNTALHELSITSIRVACSKLSDIAGFNLEIDEAGLDQFGLTQRETARDTRHGTGFKSYKGEFQESLFGKEGKQQEKIPGALEIAERNARMRQMDTPMSEITTVMDEMKPFGTVEYKPFANTSGPVLIVVPEMHKQPDSLTTNFELLLAMKDHIALLATEGGVGELTHEELKEFGTGTKKGNITELKMNRFAFSAEAAEDVLRDKIRTLGVENLKSFFATDNQNIDQRLNAALDENPELKRTVTEDWEKLTKDNSTIDAINGLYEIHDKIIKGIHDAVINYRNQIWLNAIQQDMLENPENLSSENNIVFLVCGAGHQKDLLQQAEHYGFKGVVHFTPEILNEPYNKRKLLG